MLKYESADSAIGSYVLTIRNEIEGIQKQELAYSRRKYQTFVQEKAHARRESRLREICAELQKLRNVSRRLGDQDRQNLADC